jgi:NADPH:quinone reductase
MVALLCKDFGGLSSLAIEEISDLTPAHDEVLIEVAACSVNFPDLLIIQNKYQFKPKLPFSPGGEVSGIVARVGNGVTNVKVGDQVFALCGWGGMAEQVVVREEKVFLKPPFMNFTTAASIMYNYGTSYHALKDRAKLKRGDTVLVLAGAGGVGLAAVELAKAMGASVIAAASTAEKLQICCDKGADYIINYEQENIKERISQITNGQGVDVVFDPVGGKYTEPSLRSMAWDGRYLVVGFAAGEIPKVALNLALLKGCAIVGVFWGQFATKQPNHNSKNLEDLAKMFVNGTIKPNIYKKYPLHEAKQALKDMAERQIVGKAVVICNENLAAKETIETLHPQIIQCTEASKTVFNSFDDIRKHTGKQLGESEWHIISQDMIDEFSKVTGDEQWIHVDIKRARLSPFGSTIAHGLLTLALSPMLLNETYQVNNLKMGINYGSDKVRFLQPIPVDSQIKVISSLKSVSDVANQGLKMIVEAQYFISTSDKPVCVAELISVLY